MKKGLILLLFCTFAGGCTHTADKSAHNMLDFAALGGAIRIQREALDEALPDEALPVPVAANYDPGH